MRRLVDSVIFCLVAYTLLWPILRGLVHTERPTADLAEWTVVGRCEHAPTLEVVLRGHDGDRAYAVTCDADGDFRLPIRDALLFGQVLEVRKPDGTLLTSLTLEQEEDGVVDVGELAVGGSPPN